MPAAAIYEDQSFSAMTDEQWRRTTAKGVFYICRRSLPHMREGATNVTIASDAAHEGSSLRDELGLPRQVTYHLMHTLLSTSILRKKHNRYIPGLAAAPIPDGFRCQLASPEIVAPRVRVAIPGTGETAYASGWVDDKIVVLATARDRSAVQDAEVPHGFSSFAHVRATGKLLLVLADPETRNAYLKPGSLVPVTGHIVTDREVLFEQLRNIAEQRYAVDEEEFSLGVCCLAVPFEGFDGVAQHLGTGRALPCRFQHMSRRVAPDRPHGRRVMIAFSSEDDK